MEWYEPVKHLHRLLAYFSVSMFLLRFLVDIAGHSKCRRSRWRHLPHLNDTLLLSSAVVLIFITGWRPGVHLWVTLKLGLVVGYIVAGWFAMRPVYSSYVRWLAFVLAALQVILIFYLAMTKPL